MDDGIDAYAAVDFEDFGNEICDEDWLDEDQTVFHQDLGW
jgi:hypothetical protein